MAATSDLPVLPAACLLLAAGDNTVTALRALRQGETIMITGSGERGTGGSAEAVRLLQDIPFAHKFARCAIPRGGAVRKYGEVIGRATADIAAGAHVHVHNVEGLRAGSGREA